MRGMYSYVIRVEEAPKSLKQSDLNFILMVMTDGVAEMSADLRLWD